MIEIRVLTIPLDPRTGLFDDGAVREYLADREVLRAEPHFFTPPGSPPVGLRPPSGTPG